jgi:hypothetical protein
MLQRKGWLATGVFIIVMLATLGCDARASKAAEINCSVMTKFAKRHYEAIAQSMQWATSQATDDGVYIAINNLAALFARDNSRFDRDRFLRACKPGDNVRARTS